MKKNIFGSHALQLAAGVLIFVLSCAGGSPEYQSARRFIDAYYVMADQAAARELVSDFAKEKIESEIKLLEGVNARGESYRSRAVEFEKLKEDATETETHFLFKLILHVPQLNPIEREIGLTVDKATQKIKFFGEIGNEP